MDRAQYRFLLLFLLFSVALTALIRWEPVDETVIRPYTSMIASLTGLVLAPVHDGIRTRDTLLIHPDFAVDLRRGCDGVVATLLLISACLAYPAGWRWRLTGIALGYVLIFFLNLLRIIVLFELGRAGLFQAFEIVHSYVAQFIVIAAAMVFWTFWISRKTPVRV